MDVRCPTDHKLCTALQSAATNPSAPHVGAQNLSRNTITISSLYLNALLNALNALLDALNALLLNASRHRRATTIVFISRDKEFRSRIVIIISIFCALAVPFLSENSVCMGARGKQRKRKSDRG